MSNDQIVCLNGKECSYNSDCKYYEGDFQSGKCTNPDLVATSRRTPPTEQTQTPIAESDAGGVRYINTLKEGEKSTKNDPIKIKGTLVFDARTNERNTRNGPTDVTDLLLKDDTGEVKISFWGTNGNDVKDFKKGDKLFFEGLYKVDKPFDNKPQMTGGKFYQVAKLN